MEDTISALKPVLLRKFLNMGYTVLNDGTNSSYSSIVKILKVDRNAKPIVIPTDPYTCIERAKLTNQADLEGPIWRMHDNLKKLWNDFSGEYAADFDLNNKDAWDIIVDRIRETIKVEEPRIV
jgi:hypothetical protein